VTTLSKFLIIGEQRFVAVVIAGDAAEATRLWVCVAADESAAGSGWVGCWSSASGKVETASSLERFLEELRAQIARVGRTGPFGAYLDDHLFFDGWDAWGIGIPAPIGDLIPVDVLARAESYQSGGDLVDRLFGREQRAADSDW
jgi:hypothetical protein